jgi:hypothetical protein
MISISLTDFVDFVASSGSPKLTKVTEVKNRADYHPGKDFWKTLRDAIVEFHNTGQTNKKYFDQAISGITEKNRKALYPEVVKKYKSFLGNKQITSSPIQKLVWSHAGLDVRANPELLLTINDDPHLVKLYFKKETLSKNRVAIIQLLLQLAFSSTIQQPVKYCVLDIQRNKLYSASAPDVKLRPLLEGEATAFVTIYNALP